MWDIVFLLEDRRFSLLEHFSSGREEKRGQSSKDLKIFIKSCALKVFDLLRNLRYL